MAAFSSMHFPPSFACSFSLFASLSLSLFRAKKNKFSYLGYHSVPSPSVSCRVNICVSIQRPFISLLCLALPFPFPPSRVHFRQGAGRSSFKECSHILDLPSLPFSYHISVRILSSLYLSASSQLPSKSYARGNISLVIFHFALFVCLRLWI